MWHISLSVKNLKQFCEIFHCSLDYVVTGKTTDQILSKIPDTIVEILYSDDTEELERSNRYLQIYVELMNHSKD